MAKKNSYGEDFPEEILVLILNLVLYVWIVFWNTGSRPMSDHYRDFFFRFRFNQIFHMTDHQSTWVFYCLWYNDYKNFRGSSNLWAPVASTHIFTYIHNWLLQPFRQDYDQASHTPYFVQIIFIQGPPNNFFFLANALKKILKIFSNFFIFYLKVQSFQLIMENNFFKMAVLTGHAVSYTNGPIFKHIIDCVQLYFTNGFTNIVL